MSAPLDASGLAAGLLRGATVRVELAGLPAVDVDLSDDGGAPGVLVSALRPRVTLMQGGRAVATVAPAGDPHAGIPWGAVVVGGAVVGFGLLVWAALR